MSDTRRTFLLKGFSAGTTAWLAANWPTQVAAAEAAQAMGDFTFFTPAQAMEIDAMAAQIYPSDSTPGAKEAQVIYFIDLALVTFALRAGDEATAELLPRVNRAGSVFLSHARVGGRHAIRLAVGGTLTSRADVLSAWRVIAAAAGDLLLVSKTRGCPAEER